MGEPNQLADQLGEVDLAGGFWKPWGDVETKAPPEMKNPRLVRGAPLTNPSWACCLFCKQIFGRRAACFLFAPSSCLGDQCARRQVDIWDQCARRQSENARSMLGLSVYMRRCQSGVLQVRRALTCTGRRTFDLAPGQLDRDDGGRAGPGIWHLQGRAGKRGRLGGDAAALRKVAGQMAAESILQRFQSSDWPLTVQIRQFGDLKSEPVVGAPQPEQKVQLQQAEAKNEPKEAEAKLKEAEAKLKDAKIELKEAEAKLKEAEAKLKEAEAKLKEAKATGTEEDVGLARRKMDFALEGVASSKKGVASSQNGIASAQELVDACTKRVAFLLKQPAADFRVFVPFEFPKSLDELFPRHGIGKQLFSRGTFVAGAVKSILESRLPHYWRGAPGSGKTLAGFLDNYKDNSFFSALAAEGADVFLLIDEVQDSPNSPHWVYLLKNHPKNLIAIGVGITNLQNLSAPFPKKFPDRGEPPPMSVSEQDLSDVTEFWCRQSPHVPIKLVSDICYWLFRYTGGHFFPFLKFTEAVFSETVVNLTDLHSVAKYVLSQEFSQSAAYIAVKERCFNTLSEEDPRDYGKLEKVGYWDAGRDWFISDLFTAQVFRNRKVNEARDDELTINENAPLDDNVRILITAGLQDMQQMDFEQPTSFNHRYENGLAFIWGWHLSRKIPSLFISPQTQALPTIQGKSCPRLTFTLTVVWTWQWSWRATLVPPILPINSTNFRSPSSSREANGRPWSLCLLAS
eukprot:g80319.t1